MNFSTTAPKSFPFGAFFYIMNRFVAAAPQQTFRHASLPDQTAAAATSDRPAGQAFSVRLPILSHTRAWCALCVVSHLVQEESMPLIGPKEMFAAAYAGRYAVGAFNVNNMEIVQGIMQAASEEKSPVILQVSSGARSYAGQKYLMKLVEAALAEDPSVPVVVHLDHGSHLPYEENIALTKQVVEYAHPRGIWVEAELGKLAGVEEHVSNADHVYTDPDQAVDFVERTGCDSLAVAIGTSHGAYKFKGEAKLDFERLEEIGKRLPGYPLVLHGASSVPQEFVEACNKFGGQMGGARQYLVEHPEAFDPRAYLKPARQAVKDMVAHKIRNVMGSSGKA